MRKKIMLFTLMLFLILPIKTYAESTTVEIKVSGKVKKGQEISILVNANELQGLYAASVNFKYDKNALKILEINSGESIKKYSDEIMEIGGEVDSNNNKTSYSFTFLGDKEGLSGNVNLAVIKAEVLNENINIEKDTLEVKLVKRAEDTVEDYKYKFIGYTTGNNKPSIEENQDNQNSNDSSSSQGGTSDNNPVGNEDKGELNTNDSNSNQGNNQTNGSTNIDSDKNSNTNNQSSTNDKEENDKTSENSNNNSNKDNNDVDKNDDESDKNNLASNENEDKESINNENSESEDKEELNLNKDDKEIESKNNNRLILAIFLLIVLSILAGVMYYKRKKVNFRK